MEGPVRTDTEPTGGRAALAPPRPPRPPGAARFPTHAARLPARATRLAAGGVAALGVLGAAACGGPDADGREFLSVATAGTGGIYYPLGGALASHLSLRDPGRQFTAEVTGGSVENINRLRRGEVDLAMVMGITMYEAHEGGTGFERPVPELRVVAPLYPNLTHVLVRADAPLRAVSDLGGRRVSVGPPGSGTEQLARQLLAAHGLGYDDLEERFLSFAESSAALRDGAIDAAILSVGYPASAVLEATTTAGVRLLPVDAATVDALAADHPYYFADTIPAGVYPGVAEPVPTLAVMNWIVAMESLEGEVVRGLLDILADPEARADLERVNDIVRQIDVASLARAPIPLHPAAAAWRRAGAGEGLR